MFVVYFFCCPAAFQESTTRRRPFSWTGGESSCSSGMQTRGKRLAVVQQPSSQPVIYEQRGCVTAEQRRSWFGPKINSQHVRRLWLDRGFVLFLLFSRWRSLRLQLWFKLYLYHGSARGELKFALQSDYEHVFLTGFGYDVRRLQVTNPALG